MQLFKFAEIQNEIYWMGVFTAGGARINPELFSNNPSILYVYIF